MNLVRQALFGFSMIAAAFTAGTVSAAEPGFYVGGSYGQTTIKASTPRVNVGVPPTRSFDIDNDEDGYKAYLGYNFIPWFGLEGGYVVLGNPEENFLVGTTNVNTEIDAKGFEGFAVVTLPLGPFDVFGKVGGFSGTVDFDGKVQPLAGPSTFFSADSDNADGMLAYGAGAAFNFGHWSVRAEYEEYDADNIDDLYFISAGLVYHFGREEKAVPVAAPAPAPRPVVAAAPAKCPDGDMDGVCDAVDQCPNTPAGARVGPAGCDCDYALRTHFAFDSAELTAVDKEELDRLATVLLNPKLSFVAGEIDGHTDNIGAPDYNLALSKRRADAVASYLKSKGVAMGDRFFTQGFGDTKPIADNKTEEGRAQNRRATIHRTDCGPAN